MVPPSIAALLKVRWPLRDALEFSGIFVLVAVTAAAVSLHKQLDDTIDAMPTLICKKPTSHSQKITMNVMGMAGSPVVPTVISRVVGEPEFYHLPIENRPKGTRVRQTAKSVAGTVEILYQDGGVACARKLHRWEHAPDVTQAGKGADLQQAQDIAPNGIECKLDIAMKYDDEDSFYTPTNESSSYMGFRDPRYKFAPGIYLADIELAGENICTRVRCRIVNAGEGQKLKIDVLSSRN